MVDGIEPGYPEPPAVGSEAATLLGALERQRATLAWKCADLDQAGLSVGVSSVTLGGLLKHLAYMEDINFSRDLAGRGLPSPWTEAADADEDWEWRRQALSLPGRIAATSRSALAVMHGWFGRALDVPFQVCRAGRIVDRRMQQTRR